METSHVIICQPDLSLRKNYISMEKYVSLLSTKLFDAWTTQLTHWFAAPGSMLSKFEVNTPFFFETFFEGVRHPHYGRYLRLEKSRLVEFTWITGKGGTEGVETVVTIELHPQEHGTLLRLTHAGFPDEESKNRHQDAWPQILNQLEERMSRPVD